MQGPAQHLSHHRAVAVDLPQIERVSWLHYEPAEMRDNDLRSEGPVTGEFATRRERAVDRAGRVGALAAGGLSNKEIAVELGLAQSTISRLAKPLALPSHADAARALEGIAVLTESERDVLVRAAAGESAKQIAGARGSSPRTIANQLRSAYDKLGVGSRRELRALIGASRERNK